MKHIVVFTDHDLMRIGAGDEVGCNVNGELVAFMSEHRYKRLYEQKDRLDDKKGE